MGGSSSKEEKPLYRPPPPTSGQIQIGDSASLPKLQLTELSVKKPAPIKTGGDLKREAEQEKLKDLVAFDLDKEFD